MKKYTIKDEFLLRGIEQWKFIFDKGLVQLSGEKSCLINLIINLITLVSQHQFDRTQKKCMVSMAVGIPKDASDHSVLALEVQYLP